MPFNFKTRENKTKNKPEQTRNIPQQKQNTVTDTQKETHSAKALPYTGPLRYLIGLSFDKIYSCKNNASK